MKVWIAHEAGLGLLGDLPEGMTVEVVGEPDGPLPSDPAAVEFWVPPFLSAGNLVHLTSRMTALAVIQLMSAGADAWVGRVPPGVTLCDSRGVHSASTSEWVVTAILSYLRAIPAFVRGQAARDWSYRRYAPTDELTAYNRYLAMLAIKGKPKTWRNPRGE